MTDPGTDQIDAAFREAQTRAEQIVKQDPKVLLIDFTKLQPRPVSDWLIAHAEDFEQRRIRTCKHAHLTTRLCYMIGWRPQRAWCERCVAPHAERYRTSASETAHFDCVFCGSPCGVAGPIPIVAAVPPTILLLGAACARCAGIRQAV